MSGPTHNLSREAKPSKTPTGNVGTLLNERSLSRQPQMVDDEQQEAQGKFTTFSHRWLNCTKRDGPCKLSSGVILTFVGVNALSITRRRVRGGRVGLNGHNRWWKEHPDGNHKTTGTTSLTDGSRV